MESKHTIRDEDGKIVGALLIEPVWNRNEARKTTEIGGDTLLIEPVWNRNSRSYHQRRKDYFSLLIEPVWNRNLELTFTQKDDPNF